jgi:hypothetical protein
MAYYPLKVKDNSGNTHIVGDPRIADKADKASPALTGTPTAPTAAVNTNTTQIATTAYVVSQIADDAILKNNATQGTVTLVNVAPGQTPLAVAGAFSQTAVLFKLMDVYGTTIFSISATGAVQTTGSISASALTLNGGVLNAPVVRNTQAGSYTLVLSDAGKLVEMNSASANTLTIPANSSIAFPIGSKIDIVQTGAGECSIAPASGVTLNSDSSKRKINAQWAAATLVKRDTDTWVLIGALKA